MRQRRIIWARFEAGLDELRVRYQVPGMSGAIVKDKAIVWARGFGYADLEKQKPATDTTSYHAASLTKTFAAIIVMQLVEAGKLDLEQPVSNFGIDLPWVRVIHILMHTSEGKTPGDSFKYNGARFMLLDNVVEAVSGKTFAELVVEKILSR